MPKFISDEEMSKLEQAQPAAPKKFISDDEMSAMEQQKPTVGALEAGALGAAQGATLNFADELYGGIKGGIEALTGDVPYEQAYEQARNEARIKFKNAEEAQPEAYLGGQLAGGVATAFVPGLNVAKGATLAKTVGTAALGGALAGTGAAEEMSDIPKSAAIGAGLGAAGGAAASGVSAGVQKLAQSGMFPKLAEKLGIRAQEAAAQGLGLERGTFKKLGEDKVRQVGQYALDEGIVSAGLKTARNPLNMVTGSAATEAMQTANEQAIKRAGLAREGIYSAIDESGFGKINPQSLASQLEGQLGTFNRASPLNAAKERQLQATIEAIRSRGDQPIGIRQMQDLVEELQSAAKYEATRESGANEIAKQAARLARGEVNETAAQLASEIGVPGAKEIVTGANKAMSSGFSAQKLLENRLAREQGNKIFGLTDTIVGGTAGAAGALASGGLGAVTGASAIAANKALDRYGALAGASVMNKLSNVVKQTPQVLGKYAPVLQQAAQKGAHSLAVTNYLLQQKEPEYRDMIKQIEEQDRER